MAALVERIGSNGNGDRHLAIKATRHAQKEAFSHIVCGSSPLRNVLEKIKLAAPCRSTVLVTGDSGTGKELVARAIHRLSPRSDGPFVALNCAAIPRELAESELFGHCKGAFSGATESRVGKFMAAHRGTLLIDEIGEMELPIQAKLLRTLETRTVSPVGSNDEQVVDVRVVAATHRDPRALTDQGRFREDLFYRLNVVHVHLPPLHERQADLPLLVETFLRQLNAEHGRQVRSISADAMLALRAYRWPGNIRELRNMLEGIVVLSKKVVIELADLPSEIRKPAAASIVPRRCTTMTLDELERDAIQERLIEAGGRRQRAAELLGISVRTLIRKIQKYKLNDPLRAPTVDNGQASAAHPSRSTGGAATNCRASRHLMPRDRCAVPLPPSS